MSPDRQPRGSPGRRKIDARAQIPIYPSPQTKRKPLRPSAVGKRGFDPHDFLAAIGEGRKSVQ